MFCAHLLVIPTVCGQVWYSSTKSSPCSHLPGHVHKQEIYDSLNPSLRFKVSYTSGIAPRTASECLLLPHHLRSDCLLQQGRAWLYSMPPCTGGRAEMNPGQSRFTPAQVLALCSCRILQTTGVFPRKPIPVLTCSFVISKTENSLRTEIKYARDHRTQG